MRLLIDFVNRSVLTVMVCGAGAAFYFASVAAVPAHDRKLRPIEPRQITGPSPQDVCRAMGYPTDEAFDE